MLNRYYEISIQGVSEVFLYKYNSWLKEIDYLKTYTSPFTISNALRQCILNRERWKKIVAAVNCGSSNLSTTCLDCGCHLKLKHVMHVSPLQSTRLPLAPAIHSTDSNP